MKNSLRLVDFEVRNDIVREAIARVREAAKARTEIHRKIPKIMKAFFDESEPNVVMKGLLRMLA